MTERTFPGDPSVVLTLRRSRAARRYSLRVSRLDGRVTLTLPARASEADALAFAAGQADWVRRMLARTAPRHAVELGSAIPFEGRMLTLVAGAVRAARVEGEVLLLPSDPARVAARTEAFLKLAARDRLTAASDRHAKALGRAYRKITLRDPSSRWGSCAADGSLMYSWRLIMAPPDVLDYVAAHEVAHLVEMNHSQAFWDVVELLMPGYGPRRHWLKTKGNALHAIRFGD